MEPVCWRKKVTAVVFILRAILAEFMIFVLRFAGTFFVLQKVINSKI